MFYYPGGFFLNTMMKKQKNEKEEISQQCKSKSDKKTISEKELQALKKISEERFVSIMDYGELPKNKKE